jgi:excisionase family DNA binding protein
MSLHEAASRSLQPLLTSDQSERSMQSWLTAEDVSKILGIHVKDVYRLMASGEIPARKFGRRWRVPPSEVANMGTIVVEPRVPRPRREPASEPPPVRRTTPKPATAPRQARRITMKDIYGAD